MTEPNRTEQLEKTKQRRKKVRSKIYYKKNKVHFMNYQKRWRKKNPSYNRDWIREYKVKIAKNAELKGKKETAEEIIKYMQSNINYVGQIILIEKIKKMGGLK